MGSWTTVHSILHPTFSELAHSYAGKLRKYSVKTCENYAKVHSYPLTGQPVGFQPVARVPAAFPRRAGPLLRACPCHLAKACLPGSTAATDTGAVEWIAEEIPQRMETGLHVRGRTRGADEDLCSRSSSPLPQVGSFAPQPSAPRVTTALRAAGSMCWPAAHPSPVTLAQLGCLLQLPRRKGRPTAPAVLSRLTYDCFYYLTIAGSSERPRNLH